MNRIASASLALLSLAAGACSGLTGPEYARRLAVIELSPDDPVVVEVPATAARGVAFDVAITTYAGGCVRQADTGVVVRGLAAVVEPHQRVVVDGDAICTADLRMDRSVGRVRFATEGTARITFRGIREPSGETITVERTVLVQ